MSTTNNQADVDVMLTADIANSVDIILDAYREGFRVRISVDTKIPVLRLYVQFANDFNDGDFCVEVPATETIKQTMLVINAQIRFLLSKAAIRELAILKTQEDFHVN
jgi:hypothetical protein